jgi:hypothetical protein
MCVETYSHLSPRGRINNIERDAEKEHKEAIAKFKASALPPQVVARISALTAGQFGTAMGLTG